MSNNNDVRKETFKNEVKGRGLFYAVIAVATFIIMAVGATFAYFTATTNSADSSVKAGSTTLQLKYISYESGWMSDELIPASSPVVEYSFESQNDTTIGKTEIMNNGLCRDDDGNSICSVYVFQVANEARSEQSVSIDVISESNSFGSLNAMAYEISVEADDTELYNSTDNNNKYTDPEFRKKITDEGTDLIDVVDNNKKVLTLKSEAADGATDVYDPVYVNRAGVTKTLLKYQKSADVIVPAIDRLLINTILPDGSQVNFGEGLTEEQLIEKKTTTVASNIGIDGKTTKTFALVIYILDNGTDQTSTDADKDFTGRVVITSGDGQSGVSGTISVVSDPDNEAYQETISNLQSTQQREEQEKNEQPAP